MKIKFSSKDNYFILLIGILLISFIIILYQKYTNHILVKEVNEYRYENVEKIRCRNESILNVLNGCISANKITNEELVILYKNYSDIANCETELWQAYIDKRKIFFLKNEKNIVKRDYISEVYWDIEQLIYNYLKDDLRENVSGMELQGTSLADFSTLLYLAKDLNDYFVTYYDKNYKGLKDEAKMNKMMKNNNWINILNGIQDVSEKYIDYPFIYEMDNTEVP